MARDSKEVLCWSALVQARIELSKLCSFNGKPEASAFIAASCSKTATHSHVELAQADAGGSPRNADVDGSPKNADACGLPLNEALTDGLKIARECGFGLYHIDLLLVRVRWHLLQGNSTAALDDLRVALDAGLPADANSGQVELLAATHPECGYAWAIAEGLSLRGEALLHRAAQMLDSRGSLREPALRGRVAPQLGAVLWSNTATTEAGSLEDQTLARGAIHDYPADIRDVITQAEANLNAALERWQSLRDPEPNNANFIHPETGTEYNNQAAETYTVLARLARGELTPLPTFRSGACAMKSLTMLSGCSTSVRAASLVLIHGLQGDPKTSWMANTDDDGTLWPNWMAEDVNGLQIWSAGYEAGKDATPEMFDDIASNLLESLHVEELTDQPLVFVAHSCGGLVLKHLLKSISRSTEARDRTMVTQLRGIAFLGTPHLGAMLGWFKDELLHRWFVDSFIREHSSVAVRNYYETLPTKNAYLWFLPGEVVSKKSAIGNMDEKAIGLTGKDHVSMCKASSRQELLYKSLKTFVTDCLGDSSVSASNESRNAPDFDVFLSHNSKDKPAVKKLGLELKRCGLNPWLDEWELRPGLGWQDALEEIIKSCQSAAICVADNGIGPWENPEMKALLRRFVNEKKSGNILPVIPVLLPGAPADLTLPPFLEEFTWVDLRTGLTKDGLDKLLWGITGKKPSP